MFGYDITTLRTMQFCTDGIDVEHTYGRMNEILAAYYKMSDARMNEMSEYIFEVRKLKAVLEAQMKLEAEMNEFEIIDAAVPTAPKSMLSYIWPF